MNKVSAVSIIFIACLDLAACTPPAALDKTPHPPSAVILENKPQDLERGIAHWKDLLKNIPPHTEKGRQTQEEAIAFFQKAAEHGYEGAIAYLPCALSNLGHDYYVSARDQKKTSDQEALYAKALYWLSKAADESDTRAQYTLGQMYRYHLGGASLYKNPNGSQMTEAERLNQAILWYITAKRYSHTAGRKEARAAIRDAESALEKLRIKKYARPLSDPSSTQNIQDGEKNMAYWNDVLSKDSLETEEERQTYQAAVAFFEKAANQGDAEAQYILGNMYNNKGLHQDIVYKNADGSRMGPDQSLANSLVLLKKAAAQGHAGAQYSLGYMYNRAHGWIPEYKAEEGYELSHAQLLEKAILLYTKSAAQGNIDAIEQLPYAINSLAFEYYSNAKTAKKDQKSLYAKALYWLSKDADNRDPYTQYTLGEMYRNHLGGASLYRNPDGSQMTEAERLKKAIKCYVNAAERGYKGAQEKARKARSALDTLLEPKASAPSSTSSAR